MADKKELLKEADAAAGGAALWTAAESTQNVLLLPADADLSGTMLHGNSEPYFPSGEYRGDCRYEYHFVHSSSPQ